MKLNKNGFTLIELLIVVLIIVGFASFAYPSYVSSVERARASEAVNMIATIQAAQQKHFVHYEEYGTVYHDINDFQPSIANFATMENTNNFSTDYFRYTLGVGPSGGTANCVRADRINRAGELLNRGYLLAGCYTEDFIRCYVLNGSDDGEKVCSSMTDQEMVGSDPITGADRPYYPIF